MNLNLDLPAGFVPILAGGEELIVWGLDVADVCKHSKAYGIFLEIPCGGRAPYPPAVLEAGVLCDGVLCSGRAARKQLAHSLRKTLDVLLVEIRAPLRLALSMACARVSIGQALRFGPRKSSFLDQNTLSFVTVAGAAPLEDHRGQRGVLSGPTRQGGVPGWKKNEVVQVSAGQAEGAAFPGQGDPCMVSELLATVVAGGLAGRDEYFQIRRFMHGRTGMALNLISGGTSHRGAEASAPSDACCAAVATRQACARWWRRSWLAKSVIAWSTVRANSSAVAVSARHRK